jgi:hypothetical protein
MCFLHCSADETLLTFLGQVFLQTKKHELWKRVIGALELFTADTSILHSLAFIPVMALF